jgi:hypothetical protein
MVTRLMCVRFVCLCRFKCQLNAHLHVHSTSITSDTHVSVMPPEGLMSSVSYLPKFPSHWYYEIGALLTAMREVLLQGLSNRCAGANLVVFACTVDDISPVRKMTGILTSCLRTIAATSWPPS